MRMRTLTILAACAAMGSLLAGCGDDDTPGGGADTLFPGDSIFPDVQPNDTAQPPTDSTQPPADSVQPPQDTLPMDLLPDVEDPTIASTTPADGATNVALPLTVTIEFSEPVYRPVIASQTIKLIDYDRNEIPGTVVLAADDRTVTWTPTTNDQNVATPYYIFVASGVITDAAGNYLAFGANASPCATVGGAQGMCVASFTTRNFADQDGYRAIAEAYAPRIVSAVSGTTAPHAQVPTKFDSDGDWDLSNNHQWLTVTATSLVPSVYYNVAETQTHYFIHYLLYFPWVNHTEANLAHANGTNGYLVTVEKARGEQAERPVALHSYWRAGQNEENLAWVTEESGIIRDGDSAAFWSAHAELAQATLFPEGRFTAYVTAQTHRACLWGWNQGGTLPSCVFNTTVENGNALVFAYLGGAPTPYQKVEGAWPVTMSAITGEPEALGYALIPTLSSLWPRRFEIGADAMYAPRPSPPYYSPDANRPGAGLSLTAELLDPLGVSTQAFGRPLWAWGWSPAVGSGPNINASRIVRGQLAIDPAWYVWERHSSTVNDNGLVAYDAETGDGYSVTYCFNGIVGQDARQSDPACQ